ncbi:MAG: phosphoribosylformylglycinamidine synthase subunit PurS [Candidatus Diapherotrites archaeon]
MPAQNFIEITFSDQTLDSVGISVKNDIEEDLKIQGIKKVRYSEVYYIQMQLDKNQLEEIAQKLFVDPIIQEYSINQDIIKDYDFMIEVKYHDNVTDNLGLTAEEAIKDFTKKTPQKVQSARRYYFYGNEKQVEKIALGLLCNPIIENYQVRKKNE